MITEKLLSKTRRLSRIGASLLGAVALLGSSTLFAQVKIGNNPTTVNSNAVLDVESANKGVLFPRVSLTGTENATPLTSHVAGMQVYNIATGTDVDPGIYYNDGSKWIRTGGEAERVILYGEGAPIGSCVNGTMYLDTSDVSPTEGNTWVCVAGSWSSYTPPPGPARTPFYFANSTNDAGGNKGNKIYRSGFVGLGGVKNPQAQLHTVGRILMARSGWNHTGMHNGTGANGIVHYFKFGDTYSAIQNAGSVANLYLSKVSGTANDVYVRFSVNGNSAGSIVRGTGQTVVYNTSSDARLKENVKPTQYSLDDLMKIGVKDYNYITDKKRNQTGFIAQELHKIYPGAVTVGGKDPKENPWSVDYSKLTPLLVKAVQDQQAEITSLKKALIEMKAQNQKEVASLKAELSEKSATSSRQLADLTDKQEQMHIVLDGLLKTISPAQQISK